MHCTPSKLGSRRIHTKGARLFFGGMMVQSVLSVIRHIFNMLFSENLIACRECHAALFSGLDELLSEQRSSIFSTKIQTVFFFPGCLNWSVTFKHFTCSSYKMLFRERSIFTRPWRLSSFSVFKAFSKGFYWMSFFFMSTCALFLIGGAVRSVGRGHRLFGPIWCTTGPPTRTRSRTRSLRKQRLHGTIRGPEGHNGSVDSRCSFLLAFIFTYDEPTYPHK